MARELSQEEVLDFLCQGGGKVVNASLLGHFKSFLRDPGATAEQLLRSRETFKRHVNSVAVVKQEGSTKYVVLRSRYRDLLGEELQPPTPPPAPDTQDEQVRGDTRGQSDPRHRRYRSNEQQDDRLEEPTQNSRHLQQKDLAPDFKQRDSPEPIVAVNGKPWGVPTHTAHSHHLPDYTPHLTVTERRGSPAPPHPTSTPPAKHTPSQNSSFSSGTPDPPPQPPPASRRPWRPLPGEEDTLETASPVYASATFMDLQEQRLGLTPSGELDPASPQVNGTSPQEVHFAHEEQINSEYKCQLSDSQYLEQPGSPSSAWYMNAEHPPPSLLLTHEPGVPPPDVELEVCPPATTIHSPSLPYNDMQGMWMYQMPVFTSIRCKLSLQDLEDFVDQESCGSDGSDSGEGGDCDTEHRDEEDLSSDSTNEKRKPFIEDKEEAFMLVPPSKRFHHLIEQYNKPLSEDLVGVTDLGGEKNMEPGVTIVTKKSPYSAKSFLTNQAPILLELAYSRPGNRIHSNLRENMSSSDDELIERDYRKRRRPSRTKKPPNLMVAASPPDLDRLLYTKSVTSNSFLLNDRLPVDNQKPVKAQSILIGKKDLYLKKTISSKSSSLPLDQMEHDWMVKSAAGSWLQVLGLFNMDPNLALRKDFISGYTVLHWFAKHGSVDMLQKIVTGAKLAGIELDINVRTTCGYTPLHIASIHGHYKVATMLVEKLKVNVKLRDNSGKRAWQYLSSMTSGEVWQLLGAPKGITIFPSRALPTAQNSHNGSSQLSRKPSMAVFLKPQNQKWKANNPPMSRDHEIYSD
uniref:Sosondowah ankyrin repeat domain family member B n=1 Tax=Leptobrachium leishanense TaxID=445787 RepID=A0A8C5LRI8_9ANUR